MKTLNVENTEKNLTIVDLTKKGVIATLTHYRDGYMYYNISLIGDREGEVYRLVLDITEFVNCDLEPVCSASLFRRWIRESWKNGELNRVS